MELQRVGHNRATKDNKNATFFFFFAQKLSGIGDGTH